MVGGLLSMETAELVRLWLVISVLWMDPIERFETDRTLRSYPIVQTKWVSYQKRGEECEDQEYGDQTRRIPNWKSRQSSGRWPILFESRVLTRLPHPSRAVCGRVGSGYEHDTIQPQIGNSTGKFGCNGSDPSTSRPFASSLPS